MVEAATERATQQAIHQRSGHGIVLAGLELYGVGHRDDRLHGPVAVHHGHFAAFGALGGAVGFAIDRSFFPGPEILLGHFLHLVFVRIAYHYEVGIIGLEVGIVVLFGIGNGHVVDRLLSFELAVGVLFAVAQAAGHVAGDGIRVFFGLRQTAKRLGFHLLELGFWEGGIQQHIAH